MATVFRHECQTRRSSCRLEEMARSSCSSESTERSSCNSDIVMIDEDGMKTINPVAKNINVMKSQRVRVGSVFSTVTQNVQKTNVVKDLPFHRYIWDIIKNTSKAEKASCGGAFLALIVCIMLIIYFSVIAKKEDKQDNSETESNGWFISKQEWLAINYNKTKNVTDNLPLVVIAHTAGPKCTTLAKCRAIVRNIQNYYIHSLGHNIPYNFLIGGDGRVYEGRGWGILGAHTKDYNSCSMGLAFIGDYREGLSSYTTVTDLQQQRAHMLFEQGVKNGKLHPKFQVLGALDLRPTESPGTNLYNAIKKWPNYDHENWYKGKSCTQIQELFEEKNVTSY